LTPLREVYPATLSVLDQSFKIDQTRHLLLVVFYFFYPINDKLRIYFMYNLKLSANLFEFLLLLFIICRKIILLKYLLKMRRLLKRLTILEGRLIFIDKRILALVVKLGSPALNLILWLLPKY